MKYKIGQILEGTINGIQQYGIFVRLDEKNEGLIHISEITGKYIENIGEKYKVGDKIKVMILDIDPYSDQISLSHRAVITPQESKNFRQHFWTSRRVQTGFKPLEENLNEQINKALKKFL